MRQLVLDKPGVDADMPLRVNLADKIQAGDAVQSVRPCRQGIQYPRDSAMSFCSFLHMYAQLAGKHRLSSRTNNYILGHTRLTFSFCRCVCCGHRGKHGGN